MCLDYAKTENIPQYKEGYKVFVRCRKGNSWKLRGCHRALVVFKKRCWMVDKSEKSLLSCGNFSELRYRTGFHCFLNKADAIQYAELPEVVHRVLVKEITAIGLQGQYPAFAARQIYIMEQVIKDKKKGSISWQD